MNWNLVKLLLSLCLILSIALALEWWVADLASSQENDVPKENQNANQEVELPQIKFSSMTADMFTDMVERPLFIEGRRPVAVEEEGEDNVKDVGSVDDLVLIGIYTDDKRTMALFSKKGKERNFLKKAQGDDISGWLLEKIGSDNVILEKSGQRQTLLLRKPKLKPTSVPKKPVPPRPPRRPIPTPLQNQKS